jgi:hypothetical protein
VEPQLARYRRFPRLDTVRYHPAISVEAADREVRFFEHAIPARNLAFGDVAPFVIEWIVFRVRLLLRLPLLPIFLIKKIRERV